jgi:hypothetical protein
MSRIKSLKTPVNPDYDFDADPSEQAEYVNPVTLAYKQTYLANYAADVTDALNGANRRLAEAKVDLKTAQHRLDDFESELLATYPAPTNERKSNKLLESYIRRMAFESGQKAQHQELIDTVRDIEATLELVQAEIENGRQTHNLLRLLSEQGRTVLAFTKWEEERAR